MTLSRPFADPLGRRRHSGRITAYDAWIELKEQPGSVVVKLDRYCGPMQVYAREDAQLPN